MIYINPPLVGYLERKSIYNFDETVLGYVKTVMGSPALFTSFSKESTQIEKLFTDLWTERQLLAQVRQNRGFIVRRLL